MNIVCVVLDTVRYDFLGFNGNEVVQTPNLDHFASQGVVFDNAYIGSYPCMPARRELWTGTQEFVRRGWGPLEDTDWSLPQILKTHGYTTQIITDHFHFWERGSGKYLYDFDGVDIIRGQETDNWITDQTVNIQYPASPFKLARHKTPEQFRQWSRNIAQFRKERDWFAPQLFIRAADWLETQTQSPFFLLLDSFAPHEPFWPPHPYNTLYNPGYQGDQVVWPTYGVCDLSAEEIRQVRALYAGELTLVDKWFGYFMNQLTALQLMDTTAIIVVTDHGHLFGEHGLMGKPHAALSDSTLYQELAHIPLAIWYPTRKPVPRRCKELVQFTDLFPTILELAGVNPEQPPDGFSLMPLVRQTNPASPRHSAIFGRYGEALNITDGHWTLHLWPTDADFPLYWYSTEPPHFLPDYYVTTGDLEPSPWGWRYPITLAGMKPQHNALYNIDVDPKQSHNLFGRVPKVQDRLTNLLVDHLQRMNTPEEVYRRYRLR